MDYRPLVNYEDKRSSNLATASIVMGIIAIATSCCIYSAIICGALAIIFALLSRGGEMTMTANAKVGLILGIIGLIVTIILYIVIFTVTIASAGGIDAFMNQYDEIMQQYMQYYETM